MDSLASSDRAEPFGGSMKTVIVLEELLEAGRLRRHGGLPLESNSHCEVALAPAMVMDNLRRAGYATVYMLDDNTVVVGMNPVHFSEKTLAEVRRRAEVNS